MATLDAPEPVNLVRSIFLCNVFNFLLSASKACLIPFLTIYLKKLGLSATQTGIIIGAKTLVGLVFAPLWSKCAVRCGRRRCVLMFSIFIMAATYLSLTAVPSMDEGAFAAQCAKNDFNVSQLTDGLKAHSNAKPVLTSKPETVNTTPTNVSEIIPPATTKANSNVKNDTALVPVTESSENVLEIAKVTDLKTTTKPTTTTSATNTQPANRDDEQIKTVLKQVLIEVGMPAQDVADLDLRELEQLLNELLTTKSGKKLLDDALRNLSPDAAKILEQLGNRRRREVEQDKQNNSAVTDSDKPEDSVSTWQLLRTKIYKQLTDFRDHIRDTTNQMFIVVMVILMVGESLSSPIEKIADDGWYEFLETIDDLEKYGMQRIWSTFAYILIPFLVTLIIDHTNCLFGYSIHPFMLHFHLFGGFLGLTFLVAFFYPMVTSEKYKYASKVMKGMRVVCCNLRSLMFVITLMVTGLVYASYFNFLFWLLIDMGSKEFTLGVCITIGALAEIPMLLFNDRLIKKIGNGGVVCLSVLFLSARCLYYSFLPTPWAVIPAELTHAFTHTALWWAVLSSQSFNSTPALSRSIRSILSTIYFGVGFGFGSIVSGVVYDAYGPAILFQAGAVLAIGWFPFLGLGMRCCREKNRNHVKYTRLLNSDDMSDDTDSMEDDWLEQALKER